jgi:hypothetical protein
MHLQSSTPQCLLRESTLLHKPLHQSRDAELNAAILHVSAGFKSQVSVGGLPLKLSPEEVSLALQAGATTASNKHAFVYK